MNKHLKNFILRGLMFGGFGPIVFGIIILIISMTEKYTFSGASVFTGILSTYILSFIHAGCSVFNEIERWSLVKSIGFHFVTIYVAYTLCYLINKWIEFKLKVLLIYTVVFIVSYFVIWIIVYLIIRKQTKRMNERLK